MDEQNMNVLEKIRRSYYQLTVSERKIADYLLGQGESVQYMSISQLAEECGIAEATVTRFCRSLKLKGFTALKIEIARTFANKVRVPDTASSETPNLRVREVASETIDAIQQTIGLVNSRAVDRVMDIFEKAETVLCVGSGGSMIMANECAHQFSTICAKFRAVADSHLQMSAISTLGANDAVILFSYSGATVNGVQLLTLAKQRGLKTIIVTRYDKSPTANLADEVLLCGSNEGPFQFGSVPAKVAQLIVIDVLFKEYYVRNQKVCDENIQSIAAALSGMHV